MNKHHQHNNLIEGKLAQLPIANADHLWNDMHTILDKNMPQKKERRRFIFWLLDNSGSLVLAFIFLGFSVFFLSQKQNTAIAIKKTNTSLLPGKPVENSPAMISGNYNENTITVNESTRAGRSMVSQTTWLTGVYGNRMIDLPGKRQIHAQSENYLREGTFNDPLQVISKDRRDYTTSLIDQEPLRQDFQINTNNNHVIDSLIKNAAVSASKIKPNNGRNNQNGFYAGVMLGVDLSSIHFQSVKTGSSKGFIIGYAFNNKWSVETGLLADTKRVHDDGDSFNPPGYTPSNGITIIAVNGKSGLYEWPINVKYTIINGKHNLFTTTGLSSYFMKSENYDYEYTQANQPGGRNYLKYTNGTKEWFSVVNFSVGYAHKLGVAGTVRVEPYLKIPVKNIGVGNMPIMSTGLNIGFTRQIK